MDYLVGFGFRVSRFGLKRRPFDPKNNPKPETRNRSHQFVKTYAIALNTLNKIADTINLELSETRHLPNLSILRFMTITEAPTGIKNLVYIVLKSDQELRLPFRRKIIWLIVYR